MSDETLSICSPVVNGVRMIPLTKGYCAIVDASRFEGLAKWRWKTLVAGKNIYAVRNAWNRERKIYFPILMHREIAGATRGQLVDHWNGNGLDNRRENLRVCTQSQNLANSFKTRGKSKYKGVYWNREKMMWQAQIGCGTTADGRQRSLFLGRYELEEEAALAYDRKAVEIHGEFARINLPGSDDGHDLARSSRECKPLTGESNHFARLKKFQAAEIKRRALAGEKQKLLATEFGVSTQLVSAIKTGVAWGELA